MSRGVAKITKINNRRARTGLSAALSTILLLIIILSLGAPFVLTENETNASLQMDNATLQDDEAVNDSFKNNISSENLTGNDTATSASSVVSKLNNTNNITAETSSNTSENNSYSDNTINTTMRGNETDNDTMPGVDEYGEYYELGGENATNESSTTFNESAENDSLPVSGDVITDVDNVSNTSSYYVKLDNSTGSENILVTVNATEQEDVIPDAPVIFTQRITISNTGTHEIDKAINLEEHPEVDSRLLDEAVSLRITSNNTLVSEQAMFPITLDAEESKRVLVSYKLPSVNVNINCSQQRIADLLPEDATITKTEINTSKVLTKKCTVEIAHSGNISYEDVMIPLERFDADNLNTVVDSSTQEELAIVDGTINMD